jgi:hypothetical protein
MQQMSVYLEDELVATVSNTADPRVDIWRAKLETPLSRKVTMRVRRFKVSVLVLLVTFHPSAVSPVLRPQHSQFSLYLTGIYRIRPDCLLCNGECFPRLVQIVADYHHPVVEDVVRRYPRPGSPFPYSDRYGLSNPPDIRRRGISWTFNDHEDGDPPMARSSTRIDYPTPTQVRAARWPHCSSDNKCHSCRYRGDNRSHYACRYRGDNRSHYAYATCGGFIYSSTHSRTTVDLPSLTN